MISAIEIRKTISVLKNRIEVNIADGMIKIKSTIAAHALAI